MQLTNKKILQLIRINVRRLKHDLVDYGYQRQITAIEAALHELSLRMDTEFYEDYYRRGFALASNGIGVGGNVTVEKTINSLPKNLPASVTSDIAERELSLLTHCLQTIVKTSSSTSVDADKKYFEKISSWELEIPKRRFNDAFNVAKKTEENPISRERVETYLRKKFPERENLKITQFEKLDGGFSKLTVLIATTDDDQGNQAMVIRANQPAPFIKVVGADVRDEYPIIAAAFKAGLPLPEPLWLEADESLLGTSFIVARQTKGKTINAAKLMDEECAAKLPHFRSKLVDVLLQIHGIPVGNTDEMVTNSHLSRWTQYRDLNSAAIAATEFWMEEIERHGAEITPSLQRVYDWLIANAPGATAFDPIFLHGDFGLHNILFDNDEFSTVLDWETAKIGDPAEEFVVLFLTMNTDYDEEIIKLYVARGGQPISRFRVYYYRIVVLLRSFILDAIALKNLAAEDAENMKPFIWLTEQSYILTHQVNELINKAEAAKAEAAK